MKVDTYILYVSLFFIPRYFLGPTVGSILVEYVGYDWASTSVAGVFALGVSGIGCTYEYSQTIPHFKADKF